MHNINLNINPFMSECDDNVPNICYHLTGLITERHGSLTSQIILTTYHNIA